MGQGRSWYHPGLGRSDRNRTGRLYFQAVEVPVSISVELANQGGVHLPVIKSHIIDLTIEVGRTTGSIPTDD